MTNSSHTSHLLTRKTVSLDDARFYLDALNLDYIIDAMCAKEYPLPRWLRENAIACCARYKQFLWLQKKHGGEFELVPSKEVDEFWHNHILYTQQYVNDCMHLFGYYFHHKPASPNDAPQELIDGYLKTQALYASEFA